jgi:hypothetical protein
VLTAGFDATACAKAARDIDCVVVTDEEDRGIPRGGVLVTTESASVVICRSEAAGTAGDVPRGGVTGEETGVPRGGVCIADDGANTGDDCNDGMELELTGGGAGTGFGFAGIGANWGAGAAGVGAKDALASPR